jgi:hypothetical protein
MFKFFLACKQVFNTHDWRITFHIGAILRQYCATEKVIMIVRRRTTTNKITDFKVQGALAIVTQTLVTFLRFYNVLYHID